MAQYCLGQQNLKHNTFIYTLCCTIKIKTFLLLLRMNVFKNQFLTLASFFDEVLLFLRELPHKYTNHLNSLYHTHRTDCRTFSYSYIWKNNRISTNNRMFFKITFLFSHSYIDSEQLVPLMYSH